MPAGQSGSAVLAVFILSLVLSIALSQLYLQAETVRDAVLREQAAVNSENAMVALQMALSNPPACALSLTNVGFGTTFAEMQNLNMTNNIAIQFPPLVLGGPPTPLRVGSRLLKTTITALNFLPPVQLVSTQTGYLVELDVRTRSLDLKVERAFRIPFLIATDGAGAFVSCQASSKAPSGPRVMVIENDLCSKFSWDPDFIYFYEGRFCGPVSLLPTPPSWWVPRVTPIIAPASGSG